MTGIGKKKRIMREFRLDEISAVTVPAQAHAKMVIMKRGAEPGESQASREHYEKLGADEIEAAIAKGQMKLTNAVNGHSHLLDLDMWERERGGGYTSTVGNYERGDAHSHPFVINEDGTITIGEAMGHTHEVSGKVKKGAPLEASPGIETVSKDGETMTEQEKIELAKFQALATMNDAQKAHFGKLSGADADAFLKASSDERDAIIKVANSSDPVVYKALDGSEYRQSDDPRLVAMAKNNDATMNTLKAVTAAANETKAEALAKSWGHIGKPMAEKINMAKGILALPDEAQKSALDAINAGAAQMAPLFKAWGAVGGNAEEDGTAANATAKLNKLAEDRAAEKGISKAIAMDDVLQTAEGAQLYSQSLVH